ncbi:hypothetical protein AArcMg_0711 [Natrarchaeobaculum sulfurireducens]|uniref:Uncharacterized protein n=1 Tax=Natrarchaeobaculum sulfurireducens TaxID=2044521 RepID=A0A346PI77_9EURY|nr:hypothetical protein AArc1_2913 [Natrarchaeobaculum sulfurireducens]AXR80733.1 hypothetical protein AArcMg_0711 [Natrarchaeobaculum sulfurireducens]
MQDRGFTLEASEYATTARNGPAGLAGVDAPLEVVHLADGNPLTVVSAIANAANEGRVPVLVTDQWSREAVTEVVTAPFLLAGERDGARRFYALEDRIRLTDGSFACVGHRGELTWHEVVTDSDQPELLLEASGEPVAAVDSDELACPGPEPRAFQYRYARDDDGRLSVFGNEGTVGRYPSFDAMRTAGFRPVSAPLVPEHHVPRNGRLARATLLASVDRGSVEYRHCR